MKIRVGVIGCLGKMGKKILNELITNTKVEIAGAVARSGSKYIDSDIGPIIANLGIKVTSSISGIFELSDVVIDFTTKECMLDCLKAAVKFKTPLVSGTTGIEGVNLKEYAAEVPILWSANMSVGVNVLLKLVKKAAELLGNEYDVEIWEMHHNLKKDSPSGTAIELGKTIANASKVDFQSNQYLHSGSNIRKKGGIGFAVSRGGGVIGDHSVMFVNSDERIELNHKAIDRTTFARGAVQAAVWLYENKREIPGALFNAGCDMSNTRASVKDLNLWYGSKQVLFDINLNIYKRKVTTFIGPSGCGKSTFLRCFNRMNDYVPGCKTVGELDIDGLGDIYSRDMDVVLLRAKVGMVFQKPNPFPKSIYDNVAYGPKLHGMAKDKQKLNEMVENSLTKVGLWEELKDRLQDSALDLSGGQQQRLCIARAIAVKPTILLMDEPCSALDPMATNAIENLIQELKLRFTIIMVTHSMKQAKKLSDSVIFFHNGRIVESGSTQEIFENAQSPLTKEYILDH